MDIATVAGHHRGVTAGIVGTTTTHGIGIHGIGAVHGAGTVHGIGTVLGIGVTTDTGEARCTADRTGMAEDITLPVVLPITGRDSMAATMADIVTTLHVPSEIPTTILRRLEVAVRQVLVHRSVVDTAAAVAVLSVADVQPLVAAHSVAVNNRCIISTNILNEYEEDIFIRFRDLCCYAGSGTGQHKS